MLMELLARYISVIVQQLSANRLLILHLLFMVLDKALEDVVVLQALVLLEL